MCHLRRAGLANLSDVFRLRSVGLPCSLRASEIDPRSTGATVTEHPPNPARDCLCELSFSVKKRRCAVGPGPVNQRFAVAEHGLLDGAQEYEVRSGAVNFLNPAIKRCQGAVQRRCAGGGRLPTTCHEHVIDGCACREDVRDIGHGVGQDVDAKHRVLPDRRDSAALVMDAGQNHGRVSGHRAHSADGHPGPPRRTVGGDYRDRLRGPAHAFQKIIT